MALITVQRSSSASSTPNSDECGGAVSPFGVNVNSLTESFFVVKGAALILHKNECRMSPFLPETISDIRQHLHAMFGVIRSQDKLTLAIRVDASTYPAYTMQSDPKLHNNPDFDDHVCYVALLSTIDRFDTEEYGLVGVDIVQGRNVSIGFTMPIYSDLIIKLDGNGGLKVYSNDKHYTIRPVTVQALWSIFQALNKVSKQARACNFHAGGISHTWMEIYKADGIRSHDTLVNRWDLSDDVIAYRSDSPVHSVAHSISSYSSSDEADFLQFLQSKLKYLMTTVDLDEVTSKYLRQQLEKDVGQDLSEYGKFIDDTILRVFAHMDRSSTIIDDLYLGSEWNASNYEELKERNVGYILNVSNEIDNFFPADFKYMNVRVEDREDAQLIREWDKTYKFICTAMENKKACLVHCKMGISRSAATVIAFLMKKNKWNLNEAFECVRKKRTCVRPNAGFMEQLRVYEGILKASQVKKKLFEAVTPPCQEGQDRRQNPNPPENLGCVLANGTDYIIKRFLDSVHEYWMKHSLDTNRLKNSNDSKSSNYPSGDQIVSVRLTKPDQSWIRQNPCSPPSSANRMFSLSTTSSSRAKRDCRSSYSLVDLTNQHKEVEPLCSVQKRILALERDRRTSTPSSFFQTGQFLHAPKQNSSKLSKIQRLINLYSLGLDESKLARNMSAALHTRFFNTHQPPRQARKISSGVSN